jgi:hypothetical protein
MLSKFFMLHSITLAILTTGAAAHIDRVDCRPVAPGPTEPLGVAPSNELEAFARQHGLDLRRTDSAVTGKGIVTMDLRTNDHRIWEEPLGVAPSNELEAFARQHGLDLRRTDSVVTGKGIVTMDDHRIWESNGPYGVRCPIRQNTPFLNINY